MNNTASNTLSQPISETVKLPCGAVLKNRIAKSAMTEGAADYKNRPTQGHLNQYKLWSEGGAGLLITGNLMVQRGHLERTGNVVIDGEPDSKSWKWLEKWAEVGTKNNTHLWPQLSHAGRQTPKAINKHPISPSAVALDIPGGRFAQPSEISEVEIVALISSFANAAMVLQKAGFTGVQIHAAHGYLISDFLSPRTNKRTDKWGGTIENRSRFLLKIVRQVRLAVGPQFPISVKLNSADFQKGGFQLGDSEQVARWLELEGIDLLEISGGNYEQPMMLDRGGMEPIPADQVRQTTLKREAYFLEYAKQIQQQVKIPIMLTGGFRTRNAMNSAVENDGIDVIGLARPMVTEADAPKKLLQNLTDAITRSEAHLQIGNGFLSSRSPLKIIRVLNGFGTAYWYYHQLYLIAKGEKPNKDIGILAALIKVNHREISAAKKLWKG